MSSVKEIAQEWVSGTVIAQMTYAAGFYFRLEREVHSDELPNVVRLDVLSKVVFGDKKDWEGYISALPKGNWRGEYDEPAVALRFFQSIGSKIISTDISNDGTLLIKTSDNEKISILGIENIFDESWGLSVPEDVAFDGPVQSINCLNDGYVYVESDI